MSELVLIEQWGRGVSGSTKAETAVYNTQSRDFVIQNFAV